MSQINPLYEYWDVKYFRHEHILRMKQIWAEPVKYKSFYERLRRNPSLKEAIYTPSNTNMRRNKYNMKPKDKREWVRNATYKMMVILKLIFQWKGKPNS